MPVHTDGGTGAFWKNEFGFQSMKNDDFDDSYQNELLQLQNIFGLNFTSNMFENLSCILGRERKPNDLFYYLPWLTLDENGNWIVTEKTNMQLTFRLKVKDIRNISLVCKSNGKEIEALSSTYSVLNYNKDATDEFTHDIDHDWICSHYRHTIADEYSKLKKENELERFESFYDEVCLGM